MFSIYISFSSISPAVSIVPLVSKNSTEKLLGNGSVAFNAYERLNGATNAWVVIALSLPVFKFPIILFASTIVTFVSAISHEYVVYAKGPLSPIGPIGPVHPVGPAAAGDRVTSTGKVFSIFSIVRPVRKGYAVEGTSTSPTEMPFT